MLYAAILSGSMLKTLWQYAHEVHYSVKGNCVSYTDSNESSSYEVYLHTMHENLESFL